MENKTWCYLQNIPLPNISCTCSSRSWCACWLSGLGVYHTLFPSHLTPSSFCGNKTQIRGKRNIQGQTPNYQLVVVLCWRACYKINNFLREITEVSTCVVAQGPHSQGRFPHLSLITEKEEGWWKTDNVLGTRVCVAQCVFRHSRNPRTDINYQREKMPRHQSHVQCVGKPQCQLKYSTASRCLYYSRHT